jgi:hypothetical protein
LKKITHILISAGATAEIIEETLWTEKLTSSPYAKNLIYIGNRGLYNGNPPPPGGGGGKISADVIWGKKYEKAKRKSGEM